MDAVIIAQQDCPPVPDHDHPDDNYVITNPSYPTPWYSNPESEIGILLNGFCAGFGWREDQSCWQGAGYFSDWDVILSGQDTAIIDAHIDGFFTDVPNDAKVIMKRRISALPDLFYYDHGQGKVLVCGLYTDWGYGQSQWTNDEANLLRDIVTWALDTKREIREYYSGNAVDLVMFLHESYI